MVDMIIIFQSFNLCFKITHDILFLCFSNKIYKNYVLKCKNFWNYIYLHNKEDVNKNRIENLCNNFFFNDRINLKTVKTIYFDFLKKTSTRNI